MTDQKKLDQINELHERVGEWSDRAKQNGTDQSYEQLMEDGEFQGLIHELMDQDMDSLMLLLGKAITENPDTMPDWMDEALQDEDTKDNGSERPE